jgi:hypothetical protein
MPLHEKEEKIKELRTIEATKKRLMGMGGKFGLIAKMLGDDIVMHQEGGIYCDTHYLPDMWSLDTEPESGMPYMDMPGEEPTGFGWRDERNYARTPVSTQELGWHFDGLSRGMHLEIKVIGETKEITVHYQGYLVYKEKEGNLEAYSPAKEWEDKIDMLFESAQKKVRAGQRQEKQENHDQGLAKKANWIETMRGRWGL